MPSVDSLLQQHSDLENTVANEKRAVRTHRARLRDAKGELVSITETLEQLGIKVEQAKGEPYGRKHAGHPH